MKRTAKYGHVWRDKATSKTYGTSIEINSVDEISKYEQVLKTQPTDNTFFSKRKYKEVKTNDQQ